MSPQVKRPVISVQASSVVTHLSIDLDLLTRIFANTRSGLPEENAQE
jgi:hypothetical protein